MSVMRSPVGLVKKARQGTLVVAGLVTVAAQRSLAEGDWQVRNWLVNRTTPVLSKALWTALFLLGAVGAGAQTSHPVHYICADGTKLQAIFSPPGTSMGSVKLIYAGSSAETTLPQVVSADGGRYTQGNVEFWIKGQGATLIRAGKSTTCRTRD
jgi:membrane-bound inhibitor of C-type lysozyme